MNYIITVSVRPVQSFIAQSRKFIDLVNGSAMLAELTSLIMKELDKTYNNVKYVYPAGGSEASKSAPNLFVAEISDVKEITCEFLNSARDELLRRWDKYTKNKELKPEVNERGKSQIKELLVIDHVIYPRDDSKESEREIHNKLKELMGSAKNDYPVPMLEEEGAKCSNCGERNSLISFGVKKWGRPKPHILQQFTVKEGTTGEGLCAVCIVKRGWKKTPFDSVSDIALGYIPEIEDIISKSGTASNGQFSRQSILEVLDGNNKQREIQNPLDKILRTIKENKIKLNKYYALLMMDGDDMGMIMDGAEKKEVTNFFEMQRNISKELGRYTEEVNNIFSSNIKLPKGIPINYANYIEKSQKERNRNKLVYAGGDDVFAAFEIKHVFTYTDCLRLMYPENLWGEGVERKSTASAGIVIAHYKSPLSSVINALRKAEKQAKNRIGKNSITITVIPHSGDQTSGVFSWNYGKYRTLASLETLVSALQNGILSTTFIYQFVKEFFFLDDEWKPGTKNMLKVELKRLLYRSIEKNQKIESNREEDSHTKKSRDFAEIKEILETLNTIIEESFTPQEIFTFLKIADFMTRRIAK